jgi:hypothetical protein
MTHLKLSAREQVKLKVITQKKIMKIRAEINEMERINETKRWLFKNINKMTNP